MQQVKVRYCLYSCQRGYLAKVIYDSKGSYNEYRFGLNGKVVKEFSEEIVKIFDTFQEVETSWKFWKKVGYPGEGPISDIKILEAGTDIEIELHL